MFALDEHDAQERSLLDDLRRRAADKPKWHEFENYWPLGVGRFYDDRGLTRKESIQTIVFQIAQDLSSRLALATGLARPSDYRDQLEEIARERFKTGREFCKATSLSEDMASHLFAGRKHLSIETLSQVVERLGCALRIVPIAENEVDGKNEVAACSTANGNR